MFKNLKSASFNNLTKLVSGTVVAQAIPILAMPILTRIFDPQAFGVLSVFVGLAGVAAIGSSLRYELAIPQVEDDPSARNVFVLCLLIIVGFSLLLLGLVFLSNNHLYALLKLQDSSGVGLLYLLILSIFCSGLIQAAIFKSVRLSEFSSIAFGKIIVTGGYVFCQLLFGAIAMPAGLVFGYVMGQFLGAVYFLQKSIPWLPSKHNRFEFSEILTIGKEYKSLPIYSAPAAMVDTLCSALPLIVVASVYDLTTAGMLGMAYRGLGVPTAMVSLSVSQIILQKVSSKDGLRSGYITNLIIQSMLGLSLIIIPFSFLIYFFGEALFALAFGEEWRLAGSYAGILVVGLAVQFLASPNSVVLTLKENIKLGAFWQILRLCTISLVLFFAIHYDFEIFLYVFVTHEVVIYAIYILLIFVGAKRRAHR